MTRKEQEALEAADRQARELITRVEQAAEPALEEVARQALALLADAHALLRRAGLDALGRLADQRRHPFGPETLERVLPLEGDAEPAVRAELAVTLALLPGADDALGRRRGALLRLLEDGSGRVRQEAAAALGDLGEHGARDLLAQRLADDDPDVRFEAAFALASLQDRRALEILLSALRHAARRLDALEALKRLGDKDAVPPLWKLAEKLLLPWGDRLTTWAVLYRLGEARAAGHLLERTRARGREERAYALALLGLHQVVEGAARLAEVAEDRRDPLRDIAVRALGELGDPVHAATLRRIADDPASPAELAQDARASLGALTERKA